MLAKGKAKKLTVYLTESDTRHGRPIFELLVELVHKHGLAGATVTRGFVGYGASGVIHTIHPDLETKQPVRVEVIDSADAIDRILADVYELVDEGLVEVSDVDVVKYKPRQPTKPDEVHKKLEGKAKMMWILIGASDQWEGEPLHEAIIKRCHLLDMAGVTVFRGLIGYGASGRVHRRSVWHSADEPLAVVVVDAAEKLNQLMPELDAMLTGGMVVIADAQVAFYRENGESAGPTS